MKINWDEVRSRVQAGEAALEEAFTPTSTAADTILRSRAVQLAERSDAKVHATATIGALVFQVGEERYAIELQELAEVLPFKKCIPIPGASSLVRGVMNVRGELRPVVDLARVLSGSSDESSGMVFILQQKVGLKVDRVVTLLELQPEEISAGRHGQFAKGMLSSSLLLLDVPAVLSAAFPAKGV